MILRNQRGQSLIEYVILVALVGIATIGMVRVLQAQVKVNLGNIVKGLQSDHTPIEKAVMDKSVLRKSDFTDFVDGSGNHEKH